MLTETEIREYAAPQVFRRGEEYHRRGAVESLVRRGDTVHAEVQGSDYEPYHVAVTLSPGEEPEATCTCPYEWGGWCKHIVALLLAACRVGEIEERPPVEDLLAPLDRDRLAALLAQLVRRRPELYDEVAALASPPGSSSPSGADARAVRRRVRAALHGLDGMRASEAYWQVGAVVGEVRGMINEAMSRIRGGDARNGLLELEVITDEAVSNRWELDDSDGEVSDLLHELGRAWTDAVLATGLTPEECGDWGGELDVWEAEIEDDFGPVFEVAREAAAQGWEYPPLVRVLRGESAGPSWEGEVPRFAGELADARIDVLERQGRHEEAMRLARAEGRTFRLAQLLAAVGRVDEAVELGMEMLGAEEGAPSPTGDGVLLPRWDMGFEGRNRAPLAAWVRDLAASHGLSAQALRAARLACREAPGVESYSRVGELAGEHWPEVREELLGELLARKEWAHQGLIDVFLHEGLLDDALDAVKRSWDYALIGRVVDAAAEARPERVIPICNAQADSIMDGGRSSHYDAAVHWLERARRAYRAAGREEEWRRRLEELIDRHRKKHKLRPMLEALRGG